MRNIILFIFLIHLSFLYVTVLPVYAPPPVFSKVSTLDLYYSDNNAICCVESGGFLYVGTDESPAKIIKINLTSFEVTSRLTLTSGENEIRDLVVSGGYLYAGLDLYPAAKIVKVDLSTFTRVGALDFTSGEYEMRDMLVVTDYLYAICNTPPAKIIKVNLTDFTKVSTLNLGETEYYGLRLASSGSFLYASTISPPDSPTLETGRIVKVNLADFTRVTAINLITCEEKYPRAMGISGGFLYVSAYDQMSPLVPSKLIKIRLSDFTRNATIEYDGDPDRKYLDFYDLVIDGNFLYLGASHGVGSLPTLLKCDLTSFTFIDELLQSSVGVFQTNGAAVYDGFLYSVKNSRPAQVYKINLSTWAYDSKLILIVGSSADYAQTLVSDGAYLYGGLYMNPGGIVKIRLSDFSLAFGKRFPSGYEEVVSLARHGDVLFAGLEVPQAKLVKINATTLDIIANYTCPSFYYSFPSLLYHNGFLYAGVDRSEDGVIYKFNPDTLTIADSLDLRFDEDYVIDFVVKEDFMYAIMEANYQTQIAKIDLTTFSRVDTLALSWQSPTSCCVDDEGYLYVGQDSYPTIISKIDTTVMKEVEYLALPVDEPYAHNALVSYGYLYLGLNHPISGIGGKIVKIDLETFRPVSTLTLNYTNGEKDVYSLCLVHGSGVYLYGGIRVSAPGRIVKMYLGEAPPPPYTPPPGVTPPEEVPPIEVITPLEERLPPTFWIILALALVMLGIYLYIRRKLWTISIVLIPIIIWLLHFKPYQAVSPILGLTYDFLAAVALVIISLALLLNKILGKEP